MNERLEGLRSKCSEKEAKFLELWVNGQEKFNAYNNAGFKAKNTKVASAAICRLLKKVNCSAYLNALKDENNRKTNISRSMQLNKLENAYNIAKADRKVSGMVQAVREQNAITGLHREVAPNPEKDAARLARMTEEEQELARIVAQIRTQEKAQEKPCKVVKLPSA